MTITPEYSIACESGAATYTGFEGMRRLAAGPLGAVALVVAGVVRSGPTGPVLVFADTSGEPVEIDVRGTDAEILSRYPSGDVEPDDSATPDAADPGPQAPRGRGRPRLGVVAREVTLLPRHWAWLATQSGGTSVALRKLVDEARRAYGERDRRHAATERAYRFMSAIAGDLPGFEEATRALFAGDRSRFVEHTGAWPVDVRSHAVGLAFAADASVAEQNP